MLKPVILNLSFVFFVFFSIENIANQRRVRQDRGSRIQMLALRTNKKAREESLFKTFSGGP